MTVPKPVSTDTAPPPGGHYSQAVDETCAEVMGKHKPARAIVPCGTLHHGFRVEIEAVAAI